MLARSNTNSDNNKNSFDIVFGSLPRWFERGILSESVHPYLFEPAAKAYGRPLQRRSKGQNVVGWSPEAALSDRELS